MAFQIIRDDISKASADAIENTANPEEIRKSPLFVGLKLYIENNYVAENKDRRRQRLFSRRDKSESIMAENAVCEDAEIIEEHDEIEELSDRPAMMGAVAASRSLDDVISQVSETWQESLFRLIDDKGFDDVEVYKRANVDRRLFAKIKKNREYSPKKVTVIAFALALELNLDETTDFMSRAGYALSPSSLFDVIVQYFIELEEFDTYKINLALFDHGQPCLGA